MNEVYNGVKGTDMLLRGIFLDRGVVYMNGGRQEGKGTDVLLRSMLWNRGGCMTEKGREY